LSPYLLIGIWVCILVYVWYHPAKIKSQRPRYLAHRGLFSTSSNVVENSLDAFKRAKDQGYGVELDVQMSTDDQLVVFHDASLMRMCGVDQLVQAMTSDELMKLKLMKSKSSICLFDEVLALNLPYLMIEIKPTKRRSETVQAVLHALSTYQEPYSICSFDPRIVLEVKRQAPSVERGLIMEAYLSNQTLSWGQRIVLEFALLCGVIRPHYLSFDVKHPSFVRSLYTTLKWPSAVWTIREQAQEDMLKSYQTLIFEQQDQR
jgi:glycerophosphoryl diester phosphodiesterase